MSLDKYLEYYEDFEKRILKDEYITDSELNAYIEDLNRINASIYK